MYLYDVSNELEAFILSHLQIKFTITGNKRYHMTFALN